MNDSKEPLAAGLTAEEFLEQQLRATPGAFEVIVREAGGLQTWYRKELRAPGMQQKLVDTFEYEEDRHNDQAVGRRMQRVVKEILPAGHEVEQAGPAIIVIRQV